MKLEFVACDRGAQIGFRRAPVLRIEFHVRFEQPIGIAAFRFCLVEREIGVLQQMLGLDAVIRQQRNADAGFDGDLLTVDIERLANGRQISFPPDRRFRVVSPASSFCRMANSSPPSRATRSDLRDRRRQSLRDGLEQLVAKDVAKRIVDLLEAIEIEQVNGKLRAVLAVCFGGFADAVEEAHAVGERGQAVIVREMPDLRLGALLRGDVLMNGNPPAVRQRPAMDRSKSFR